jgi:TPP-dependent pyruvate/acetoin dehydrogenase alpha subunit
LEKLSQEVRNTIEAAVKFAIDAPYPSENEVDQDVYA